MNRSLFQYFTGKRQISNQKLSSYLHKNKLLLQENFESKMIECITDKINFKNVLAVYNLATTFKLPILAKQVFEFIECSFALVAETSTFLNTDYALISKIIKSSNLHITSELEVLNSVFAWLTYDVVERRKFTKKLLLKVRFSLFSDAALKQIVSKISYLTDDINEILKDVLKETYKRKDLGLYSKHRYCNDSKFSILVFGGCKKNKTIRKVNRVDVSRIKVKALSPMIKKRQSSVAVVLKDRVYIFGGWDDNEENFKSVEKYSVVTNSWSNVAEIYDARELFCACAFMNKIFIIGGSREIVENKTCLQFDTNHHNWKIVANMDEIRVGGCCVLFEEKIIVAGSYDLNLEEIRSVSSYDPIADNWSPMADLINAKGCHNLVTIKNKLFVIGFGIMNHCEVYDSICKKFISLVSSPSIFISRFFRVTTIGSKIYVYDEGIVKCYDNDTGKWSYSTCTAVHELLFFSCVKLFLF